MFDKKNEYDFGTAYVFLLVLDGDIRPSIFYFFAIYIYLLFYFNLILHKSGLSFGKKSLTT